MCNKKRSSACRKDVQLYVRWYVGILQWITESHYVEQKGNLATAWNIVLFIKKQRFTISWPKQCHPQKPRLTNKSLGETIGTESGRVATVAARPGGNKRTVTAISPGIAVEHTAPYH